MNVIESAISGVSQDGIRLSFIFVSQVGMHAQFRGVVRQDIGLARKNRV
jgi:hypothetical protein